MGSLVPPLDELVETLCLLPTRRMIIAGVPSDSPGDVELLDVGNLSLDDADRAANWWAMVIVVDGAVTGHGGHPNGDARVGIAMDRTGASAGHIVCDTCGESTAVDAIEGELLDGLRRVIASAPLGGFGAARRRR